MLPAADPTRRAILDRLARLSDLAPEMRFGQLVDVLGVIAAGETGQRLGNVEDDGFLAAVEKMEEDYRRLFESDLPDEAESRTLTHAA